MNIKKDNLIKVYTDGACRGNPGPGGWAALISESGIERSLSGSAPLTTNNQMELAAAINGLKALQDLSTVSIYTDSKYVLKGMTEWLATWKRKSWRNSKGEIIKNKQLWQELDAVSEKHKKVNWHWVKGHSGHRENDIVDSLANVAIDKMLNKI